MSQPTDITTDNVRLKLDVYDPSNYEPELGHWGWVPMDGEPYDDMRDDRRLMCIMHIGTNYIEVQDAYDHMRRIHIDKMADEFRFDPDARLYIDQMTERYKQRIIDATEDIKRITNDLGVAPRIAQSESAHAGALSIYGGADIQKYKSDLIHAKDTQLPVLFKSIKTHTYNLTQWMKAGTLAARAQVDQMNGSIKLVDDRIFAISLYAGLCEEITKVRDGLPAPASEKLHIMQTRCYMDEECLVHYQTGGMEFRDINAFDRWLCDPENYIRLLPHRRCMTAFRVRRHEKHREAKSLSDAFINFDLAEQDRLTFLYIRNGGQLYRLATEENFGHWLFPDSGDYDLSNPMMIVLDSFNRPEKLITVADYEERRQQRRDRKRQLKEWRAQRRLEWESMTDEQKEDAGGEWRFFREPYHLEIDRFDQKRYEPFNHASVYYDDMMKKLSDEIQSFNRISLIVQGVFDRTTTLQPHWGPKLYRQDDFERAVTLVFDSSRALHHGDPPSFKAYCNKLRESITAGSVTIGQDEFWLQAMADRFESDKRRVHRYGRDGQRMYGFYRPVGNPGPGDIARVVRINRKGEAIFEWQCRRYVYGDRWTRGHDVEWTGRIAVPLDELFNISAYKPGDFKQFFNDPRTRSDYLEWANLLLTAEEFHAGNIELGDDGPSQIRKKRRVSEDDQ